jgi:hypothetical protein
LKHLLHCFYSRYHSKSSSFAPKTSCFDWEFHWLANHEFPQDLVDLEWIDRWYFNDIEEFSTRAIKRGNINFDLTWDRQMTEAGAAIAGKSQAGSKARQLFPSTPPANDSITWQLSNGGDKAPADTVYFGNGLGEFASFSNSYKRKFLDDDKREWAAGEM